jgi:hypothetical protein
MRRRRRKHKHLPGDVKYKRGICKLDEEPVDRTVWVTLRKKMWVCCKTHQRMNR